MTIHARRGGTGVVTKHIELCIMNRIFSIKHAIPTLSLSAFYGTIVQWTYTMERGNY